MHKPAAALSRRNGARLPGIMLMAIARQSMLMTERIEMSLRVIMRARH